MKLGIIIETKELEKSWNAMRFAVASRKNGHEVKVFLMGEAVEIETLHHDKYDTAAQVDQFYQVGGQLLACGTCLKSRSMEGSDVCPLSTMNDCVEMVEWWNGQTKPSPSDPYGMLAALEAPAISHDADKEGLL